MQGDRAIGDGFDVPLAELLFLPIFVSALRSFDLLGEHEGRAQIGNLVIRRATWHAPAGADFVAWARAQELPRRVFVRSPRERKPRYVDLESPSLIRAVKRFLQDGPADGHRDAPRARPSASSATTRASSGSSRSRR